MASDEKVCPRCAETVKSAALVCRFCGYEFGTPVKVAAPASAPPPTPAPVPKKTRPGCLAALIIFAVLVVIVAMNGSSNKPAVATPSCSNDWTKCADNSDLVNNYSGWATVQVECKMQAESQARYGTPTWPWIAFGSFLQGNDYVTTGKATAIERDAQFQNGFGAMVHSKVICEYDLHSQKVTSVLIEPH
jgi:hypothetical protein